MTLVPENDGLRNFYSPEHKYFLCYEGSDLIFWGFYGQVTTPKMLEYFDTELEVLNRILELGLSYEDETRDRMVALGLIND